METGLSQSPEALMNLEILPEHEQKVEILKTIDKAERSFDLVSKDGPAVDSLLELQVAKLKDWPMHKTNISLMQLHELAEHMGSAHRAACQKKRHDDAKGLKNLLKKSKDSNINTDQEHESWPTLGYRGIGIQASIASMGIEEVIDFRNWEIGVFNWRGMQLGTSAVGVSAGAYTGVAWKGYKLDWDLQAAYITAQWGSMSAAIPFQFASVGGIGAVDANNSAGNFRVWKPDPEGVRGLAFGYAVGVSAYAGVVSADVGQSLYQLFVSECFETFPAFAKAIVKPWCGTCGFRLGLHMNALKANIHRQAWPLVTDVLFLALALKNNAHHLASQLGIGAPHSNASKSKGGPKRCSPKSTRYLNQPEKLFHAMDQSLQEATGRLEMFEQTVRALKMAVKAMHLNGEVEKIEIGQRYEAKIDQGDWLTVRIVSQNPHHPKTPNQLSYVAKVEDPNGRVVATWNKVLPKNIRHLHSVGNVEIESLIHKIYSVTCLREPIVMNPNDGIGCMEDDECEDNQVCFGNRCVCEESVCNWPGPDQNNFGQCRPPPHVSDATRSDLNKAIEHMMHWVANMKLVVGNYAITMLRKVKRQSNV
eukprot:gnl/MRDRNA2_/MRDRNA2_72888_c1_seq1.p1 gnl/MRDRNA2_/MRDRNA2_72888_c1~~gnl/MRDRNA2_/MRDRNA2_72888_c1_seq1.p1  ORF type:complete len:647 (+),score=117.48 gnl/MRDRNA2_/MRDRNA2_72888_c1_seq1:174-1943(+)